MRRNSGFRISDFGFQKQEIRAQHGTCRQIRNPKSEIRNLSRGSTLTEVLVALLIMSIGLVSLAVLFPLSVLRSVKASQFTSATDLRYNAEAIIDLYPNIIRNPINPNFQYNAGTNLATADPPNVAPTSYVIDPIGFNVIQAQGMTLAAYQNGANPNPAYYSKPEHFFGNDPAQLGAGPSNSTGTGMPWPGVARYPLTWRTSADANFVATLPDSWQLELDSTAISGTLLTGKNAPPTVTTPTQLNVTGLGASGLSLGAQQLRIVIFSADGLTSQIRNITSIGGTAILGTDTIDTVRWTEDTDGTGPNNPNAPNPDPRDINNNGVIDYYPLPANFVSNGIGNVRIETQDQRYTWLLTVRQSTAGLGNVDVVVYFKRPTDDLNDEALFPTTFTAGTSQVYVQYASGTNTSTGKPFKPFMRKGSYVFDANNAYWYRISNVLDTSATSSTLTIDMPANASNINLGANKPPRAMFPRAVVDVYPIGSKSP